MKYKLMFFLLSQSINLWSLRKFIGMKIILLLIWSSINIQVWKWFNFEFIMLTFCY